VGGGGPSAPPEVLIAENSGKIPENPGKNGTQRLTSFLQNQKNTRKPFFIGQTQYQIFLCNRSPKKSS